MARTFKIYVPLFSITLILSAFLLFSVQPMFGKFVLPLLGGSASVWQTAMVFFQAALLGGYGYAHITSKFLKPRLQTVLHVALLGLCVLILPIAIPESWANPPQTENPVWWMLGLMSITVGAPFFVLAGTAPLIQRWFSTTDHPDAHNPYFLYAASNLGSMAALLLYPVAIEPLFGLHQQSLYWMFGFIALIGLIALTGFYTRSPVPAVPRTLEPANSMNPTWAMRAKWVLLAFIPSSLMLGVTTYITTDVASAPLIWVIPLALYLLTFIIVFSRFTTLTIRRTYDWQAVAVTLIALIFIRDPFMLTKGVSVALHLAAFFCCALTCHLSLAYRRPTPTHLTEFYLLMSFGGVLGGVFNSLLAPFIFVLPLEYPLILALSLMAPLIVGDFRFRISDITRQYRLVILAIGSAIAAVLFPTSGVLVLGAMIIIGLALVKMRYQYSAFIVAIVSVLILDPGFNWASLKSTLHIERNFFGVIRVADTDMGGMRALFHGTTLHGTQAHNKLYRMVPISYYAPTSPGGQVFAMVDNISEGQPQKIAILGLGLGSVACYVAPQREYVFYEIDPAIKRVAENKNLFTYLSDCGSPYDVVIGDGRLRMKDAPDGSYDLIFLDAFSSDAIPVHLLTREAFDLYFRKLKPDGLIVVHISNRFIDLAPLVAAQAKDSGAHVWFNSNRRQMVAPDVFIQASVFGIMSKSDAMADVVNKRFVQWKGYEGMTIAPWTDDYANIFTLLWLKFQNPTAGMP